MRSALFTGREVVFAGPKTLMEKKAQCFHFTVVLFQASIKSSLPEVLNQHVFFDNSCTFGQALFDLATTHSLLNCDHLSQSRIADADIRVHPLARASDGTLLWQILEKGGLATLDNVSLDSLQV